jgi:adenine-specific DNA-methyltransferase
MSMLNDGSYQNPVIDENVSDYGHQAMLSDKKQLGTYYTPERATRILASWAIQNRTDIVLEPSFGGCEFLKSTKDRLEYLGSSHPERNLYGCDIDPNAFKFLSTLLPQADTNNHFIKSDFLTVTPDAFPKADVIIGNPPYVSRHNMAAQQSENAWAIAKASEVALSKKASLWAYFVLHSLSFIQTGGRVAWILPGSFIYAEYSDLLRKKIESCFARSLCVVLRERLFTKEGTDETSIILLCEGYQAKSKAAMQIVAAKSLDDLQLLVGSWTLNKVVGQAWEARPRISMLEKEGSACYHNLLLSTQTHLLGDVLSLTIGIVTGDSRFFVLTSPVAMTNKLPDEALVPIISKFAHCTGAEITKQDLQQLRHEGKRCLLFNTRGGNEEDSNVQEYLNSYPEKKRISNKTFKKRSIWHQPDDGVRPDGFFSCMQSFGPVLVLNNANTFCTNSVYRAKFHNNLPDNLKKAVVVSLQSTLSQLSAELEGRNYGSGALKLEPSEAKKIVILLPSECNDIDLVFAKINSLLREGKRDEARSESDKYLVDKLLIADADVKLLGFSLHQLRKNRNGTKLGNTV